MEDNLLYKKRDYLCVEIKVPKEVYGKDEEKLMELISKYNNGYIRYEDPVTGVVGKGIPDILEDKIIFFGIRGTENIESFLEEYKKCGLNYQLGERKNLVE